MSAEQPVTMFPGDRTARLWELRTEPPAVTVRCGRGTQSCERLVLIHETPGGAVVTFFQNMPDQPYRLSLPEDDLPVDLQAPEGFKRFDAEAGVAMSAGLRDPAGTAVGLEDDALWHAIVEAGCRRHLGLVEFSRAQLMDYLRRARSDRTGRLRVTYPG